MFKEVRAKYHMGRGIKAMEKAREAEGATADRLFQDAYRSFASSMAGNIALPEALYNWGLALFYEGQTKSGKAARSLFKAACEKFSTAQTIDPDNPNTETDWGVALMALARAQKAPPSDDLYEQAKAKFLAAEERWPGIAAYNLACLSSMLGDETACRQFLTVAIEHDQVPPVESIETDSDLASMRDKTWFQAIVADLTEQQKPAAKTTEEKQEEGSSDAEPSTEEENTTP